MNRKLPIIPIVLLLTALLTVASFSPFVNASSQVIYNSIPNPLPPNLVSQGFECCQVYEVGDRVQLAGTNPRYLTSATVVMSDFAKHSIWPSYPLGGWTMPITLNIYAAVSNPTYPDYPAYTILSSTQVFTVPWRPETTAYCAAIPDDAYNVTDNGVCYHGIAFPITFTFNGLIALPDQIIYGISYNTQTDGYHPTGISAPYNSLNVALTNETAYPISVGMDVNNGVNYRYTPVVGCPSNCQDVGYNTATGGLNIFRSDIQWFPYTPAVSFSITPQISTATSTVTSTSTVPTSITSTSTSTSISVSTSFTTTTGTTTSTSISTSTSATTVCCDWVYSLSTTSATVTATSTSLSHTSTTTTDTSTRTSYTTTSGVSTSTTVTTSTSLTTETSAASTTTVTSVSTTTTGTSGVDPTIFYVIVGGLIVVAAVVGVAGYAVGHGRKPLEPPPVIMQG